LILNIDIRVYDKLANEKQGLRIIKHLCDLKYYGNAIINGDLFYNDEIYIKSTAFLNGIVNIDGPILADNYILALLTVLFNCYYPKI
jgi:hypothetical protein